MTIERPMFPPRADEHCKIISFVDRQKGRQRISIRGGNPLLEGPAETYAVELEPTSRRERLPDKVSETLKNRNLRDERKPQWSKAEATREYWRACLDMEAAISIAQNRGIPEGAIHPPIIADDRWKILAKLRLSIATQLMTPAPDTRAIAWKKAALEGEQWKWTDLTRERIERAIAGDLAFLAAHPTKKSKPMSTEAKEHRRNFKEAMRRRIKDIAASRDIPDDEIRPVLSLKHQHIGEFATKYSVNLEWLLEGKGRIFEKDPITLNPSMTGSEFAAVVTTLPMADQQVIRTMVCEILQERDQ
jgi:hypothetical protein